MAPMRAQFYTLCTSLIVVTMLCREYHYEKMYAQIPTRRFHQAEKKMSAQNSIVQPKQGKSVDVSGLAIPLGVKRVGTAELGGVQPSQQARKLRKRA